MEALDGIAAAFAKKDQEIAEIEEKIKTVTADLTYNVGLVQQRDTEIVRLNEKIKETKKAVEAAKAHEMKIESKAKQIEGRCQELEKRIEDHLKEEEQTQMLLNSTKAEFETTRANVCAAKQKLQDEALHKQQEMEVQKAKLVNAIQLDEQKILELQQIARQMRETVSTMIEELYTTHSDEMTKLSSEIAQLEQGNEELVEALHDAQQRARSEVNERQKLLQSLMYKKDEIDREKAAETKAKLQQLKCDIETKAAKKKSLERELETLEQSRKSREEVIEQLRVRYETSESQIQAQASEIRRVRKQQKQEMEKLKQELLDAKQVEKEQKQRLEQLKVAKFRDQDEWKKHQKMIDDYRTTLEDQYSKLHTKTENAVAKLRDADNLLQELLAKESAMKQRAKCAAEELQRQHNEALRAKKVLDDKRERVSELKGQIAKIRAERRERLVNPKITAIQVAPTIQTPMEHTSTLGHTASDFGIATPNPDIFALSPIGSEAPSFGPPSNNPVIAELRSKLEEAKKTADEFAQHLAMKRAQVESQKAEGSKLDQLRKENALLRAKKEEMDQMKEEIAKYRQQRPAI